MFTFAAIQMLRKKVKAARQQYFIWGFMTLNGRYGNQKKFTCRLMHKCKDLNGSGNVTNGIAALTPYVCTNDD